MATTTEDAEALWQRLHAAGFVVPPVAFDGRGYLRLAAAPYNDEDDYARLAAALPAASSRPEPSMRPMAAGCGKIDRPPERCPRGGPAP